MSLGLFAEGEKITVNVANETLKDFRGTVKIGIMDAGLTPVSEGSVEFTVDALTSSDVKTFDFSGVKGARDRYFYVDLYDECGNFLARRTELGTKPKHFMWKKPNIDIKAEKCADGVMLTVTSDVFTKNVEISFKSEDAVLSDNFFDIATRDAVKILVKTTTAPEALLADMQIRTVYDIPHK